VAVAVLITWWIDTLLTHRVANGSDHAVRLAAILNYVGVTDSYTLARACGLTALLFVYAAVVIGLLGPARRSTNAAASPVSGVALAHRCIGLVALGLVAAHAVLPYFSVDPPYGGWSTGFVPFGQPVSWGIHAAAWESLGILSFYLLIVAGPTFYLVGRHRAWRWLHRLTLVAYAMAVVHVFLLGTDFIVSGPARIAVLAAQVPVLILAAARVAPRAAPGATGGAVRWAGTAAVACVAAAMAGLTVAVAAGDYSPGMRL
jgi:predicted ferric reductase